MMVLVQQIQHHQEDGLLVVVQVFTSLQVLVMVELVVEVMQEVQEVQQEPLILAVEVVVDPQELAEQVVQVSWLREHQQAELILVYLQDVQVQ